ncbi:MAG: amidohydrolase [Thermoflavifilum sp.]|nr:amidohydrolase [Thermoflavifilum sp.]
MKKDLHIALLQTNPCWENVPENLQQIDQQLNLIPHETEVVFLPEMFATGFSMRSDVLAQDMEGEIVQWMRTRAAQHKVILCGSVIIQESGNYYNRLIWMQPNEQLGIYDKRHLFAYAQEDQHYTAGNKRFIAQVNDWRIALVVCYDLRFPVWCAQPSDTMPYDVLAVVANWPASRIAAWDALLQARAIENQAYVVGVNRVGNDGHGVYYPGHSQVVDPVGKICCQASTEQPEIIGCTLSDSHLQQVRQHYPFLRDRDHFIIINK